MPTNAAQSRERACIVCFYLSTPKSYMFVSFIFIKEAIGIACPVSAFTMPDLNVLHDRIFGHLQYIHSHHVQWGKYAKTDKRLTNIFYTQRSAVDTHRQTHQEL